MHAFSASSVVELSGKGSTHFIDKFLLLNLLPNATGPGSHSGSVSGPVKLVHARMAALVPSVTMSFNFFFNVETYLHPFRTQELCESRGGRPGLPVPNSPYGLCGCKATLNSNSTPVQSCVT